MRLRPGHVILCGTSGEEMSTKTQVSNEETSLSSAHTIRCQMFRGEVSREEIGDEFRQIDLGSSVG